MGLAGKRGKEQSREMSYVKKEKNTCLKKKYKPGRKSKEEEVRMLVEYNKHISAHECTT